MVYLSSHFVHDFSLRSYNEVIDLTPITPDLALIMRELDLPILNQPDGTWPAYANPGSTK